MKLFAALLVAFAVGFASPAAAAGPAKTITLPAKNGAVPFNHKTHTALKCTTCHEDAKGGKIQGFGSKKMDKDKAHADCHECHKREAKGPQKCGDCHKKA